MPELDLATSYQSRPWIGQYQPGDAAEIVVDETTIVEMYRNAVDTANEAVFLRYFDAVFTWNRVDRDSDTFARALRRPNGITVSVLQSMTVST